MRNSREPVRPHKAILCSRARKDMTAAERVRAHRRRQRLGLDVLRVEIDSWQLVEWLIEHDWLSDHDIEQPGKVDAAFSRAIKEMTRPKKCNNVSDCRLAGW